MPRQKAFLALASLALPLVLQLAPVGARAQNVFMSMPSAGLVAVVGTNGIVLQYISGTNLNQPQGLAFDAGGNLYVADAWFGTVSKYGPSGNLITPSLISHLTNVYGLAVDQEGSIYVAPSSGAISKYGSTGYLVSTNCGFTSQGSFICGRNRILYSTEYSDIEGFDFTGQSVLFAHTYDLRPGLGIDHAGNVYANEFAAVYKWDSGLNLVRSYPVAGANYSGITALTVDASDNIYAAVNGNSLMVLDADGHTLRTLTNFVFGASPFVAVQPPPPQLRVASTGQQTLAFWTPPLTNYLLQSVSNALSTNWLPVTAAVPVAGVACAQTSPTRFFRMAGDPQARHVFVSDDTVDAIYEYDTNGTLLQTISGPELSAPYGLAVDLAGNLFVANYGSGTVSKYSPRGDLINPALISGLDVLALAVDQAGNVLVAPFSGYVRKYDGLGNLLSTKCGYTIGGGLACGPNGYVYTTVNGNLSAFDPNGHLVFSVPTSGGNLALARDGTIYLWDGATLTKYDANGNLLSSRALSDFFATELNIAVDNAGNVYVANVDGGFNINEKVIPGAGGDGAGIAVQVPPPPLNLAAVGNQCLLYWQPRFGNYPLQSNTNLASTNWQSATDVVPGFGVLLSNCPPGSRFRLVPAQ